MSSQNPSKAYLVDLMRLARFGAAIANAHTCAILLPSNEHRHTNESRQKNVSLKLEAFHSQSTTVNENCLINSDRGLIAWVAKEMQSIHVAPFNQDSRTLGIYNSNNFIRSFVGIPIILDNDTQEATEKRCGVLVCDSKHEQAFSKEQGRLLSQLALEIAALVRLHQQQQVQQKKKEKSLGIDVFTKCCAELLHRKGLRNVTLLRLDLNNYLEMQHALGLVIFEQYLDQLDGLFKKTLPQDSVNTKLNNGSLLIALDTMLVEFYKSKLIAISEHLSERYRRQNGLPQLSLKLKDTLSPFRRPSSEASALECVLFTLDTQAQHVLEVPQGRYLRNV